MNVAALFNLVRVVVAAGRETPVLQAGLALEPTLGPLIEGKATLAQTIDALPTDAASANKQRDALCQLAYVNAEILADPAHAAAYKTALKACGAKS